ncbi:MAG: Hsp20/alpha crystallin family protein [Candidatus Omnitrophota bacterium]|jgi:HSP20 family protein
MNLIKWRSQNLFDPFTDLFGLQDEKAWAPAVDIYDNKSNLVIKADLPGMTQKDIDVSVEDDVLRIKGEKKKEHEEKRDNYFRLERSYGYFERSFALPSNVDATKVKAAYKDGVLELTLPKKEEAKPKQIKVDVN